MPGRRAQDKPVDNSLCRRCQAVEPVITIRNEPLCKDCFKTYSQSKIVKRLESFRVRHSRPGDEPKLLLPLSFDASSLALLHVLSEHLKGQTEKTGRTGFRLTVLHLCDEQSLNVEDASRLSAVQTRYPEHEYGTALLEEAIADEDMSSVLSYLPGEMPDSPRARLVQLLESAKTATAQQDLKDILRRRLVISYAKVHECKSIMWPDSTTRLAERTLAETAKGRGFTIPWNVADGDVLHGIPFYHPLRDLLNKEIAAYVSFIEPPLQSLIKHDNRPIVSTKNTTIDDLVRQYFESVEQEYPSIVANVVRTAGKLEATSLSDVEMQCELCDMPLDGHAPARSRLCYGCLRTLSLPNT